KTAISGPFGTLGRSSATAADGSESCSMRRPLAFLVVLAVVVVLAGSAGARRYAPAGPNATFVITGHGWGHGVGMSQYGAYGYAQHGYGYARILAHYFQGTQLGPAPVSKVRVLL